MTSTRTLHILKLAALVTLCAACSAQAFASCGDTLSALATSAYSHNLSQKVGPQTQAQNGSGSGTSSIVGFWHIRFVVGDNTIQEAFQIWNQGGTEVHNPNVDPRTSNICLGAWKAVGKRSYKLVHRVWSYDGNGVFLGTINLSESVYLGHKGATHTGSFTLDFYDPDGNFQFEVPGNVIAERISAE